MQWASGAGAAAVGPLLDWVRKDASVDLAPHSAPLLYMIALVALRVSQDVDIPLQLEPVADVKFALWCSVHASQEKIWHQHPPQVWRLLNRYGSLRENRTVLTQNPDSLGLRQQLTLAGLDGQSIHAATEQELKEAATELNTTVRVQNPDSLARDGATPSTQRNCFLISASAPQVWRLVNRYGSL